jgi:hypothetical protein
MDTALTKKARMLLALPLALLVLALGQASRPAAADASVSNYCNPVTVGSWEGCNGSPRAFNQVYGWGDQHSVCVGIAGAAWSFRCSGGPGAGVYSEVFGYGTYYPGIRNNAAGSNTLHGVSLAP